MFTHPDLMAIKLLPMYNMHIVHPKPLTSTDFNKTTDAEKQRRNAKQTAANRQIPPTSRRILLSSCHRVKQTRRRVAKALK